MFPFLQREIDLVVALGLSEFILRQFEIPPVQIELARSGLHLAVCSISERAPRHPRAPRTAPQRGAARRGSSTSSFVLLFRRYSLMFGSAAARVSVGARTAWRAHEWLAIRFAAFEWALETL